MKINEKKGREKDKRTPSRTVRKTKIGTMAYSRKEASLLAPTRNDGSKTALHAAAATLPTAAPATNTT